MPLTRRLDANLGYACNNDCRFCYFMDRKRRAPMLSTDAAMRLFKSIKGLGIDTLEITGGEPTLRDDILDLIRFAREELRFKGISIITNGSRFADERFAARAIEAGVDDVLVSIHGLDARTHDSLVRRGGAFEECVRAIGNVLGLGASSRTNTVVTGMNSGEVGGIAGLVASLGVRKVNFICFSPLDDALGMDEDLWPSYSSVAPHLKAMIDAWGGVLDTISIKVVPFCMLQGYEHHITDLFQNAYDPYEWDYYQRVRVRRGRLVRDLAALAGLSLFMDMGRVLKVGLGAALREAVLRVEAYRHCVKPDSCARCRFDLVCPGVWKHYARRFGIGELKPVAGEKIIDVDWFCRQRFGVPLEYSGP